MVVFSPLPKKEKTLNNHLFFVTQNEVIMGNKNTIY